MALTLKEVSSLIGEVVLCMDAFNTGLTATGAVREREKAFQFFSKRREVSDYGENQGSFSYELVFKFGFDGGIGHLELRASLGLWHSKHRCQVGRGQEIGNGTVIGVAVLMWNENGRTVKGIECPSEGFGADVFFLKFLILFLKFLFFTLLK